MSENKEESEVKTDTGQEAEDRAEQELVDEFENLDVEALIPTMNVSDVAEAQSQEAPPCIIEDEQVVGLYDEILDNCRKDRESADEVLANFIEMVMNDGDASSASKEAIVNLLKIKSDTSDKMSKIADLMTRMKLKEKDTFPRYLAAQQNNKIVIESSKRDMLKSISKLTARNTNDKSDK
jgi:hypothetical protein